jgi:hypothetical protein
MRVEADAGPCGLSKIFGLGSGPWSILLVQPFLPIVQPKRAKFLKSGSSSVVERQLPKLNVAGSIPVSRSIF